MSKKIEYGDEDQYEPKSDDELNAEGRGSSEDEDHRKFLCKLQPIPDFSAGEDDYDAERDKDSDEEEGNGPESSRSRGASIGHKQHKRRKQDGGRIVVKYNRFGVPIGQTGDDLCTHVGVLARTTVPILIHDWRLVPEEIKTRLWKSVNANFVVHPRSQRQILQGIGQSFRNFKYRLKKKYILPHLHDRKRLYTPPEKYSHIKKPIWEEFVKSRLSEDFQEKSEAAKARRAKNNLNHRLSRRGYKGVIQDLCSETGVTEDEIDRSELWKRARRLKDGKYPSAVQPIVDEIELLKKEVRDGRLSIEGKNDILARAIKKLPRKGHMQGIGKHVPSSLYFHLCDGSLGSSKSTEFSERLDIIEKRLEDLTNELTKNKPRHSDVASCSVQPLLNEDTCQPKNTIVNQREKSVNGPHTNKNKGIQYKHVVLQDQSQSPQDAMPRKSPRINPQLLYETPKQFTTEKDSANKQKTKKTLEFDDEVKEPQKPDGDKKKNGKKIVDDEVKEPQKPDGDKKNNGKKIVVDVPIQQKKRTRQSGKAHQTSCDTLIILHGLCQLKLQDSYAFPYLIDDSVFKTNCSVKAHITKKMCVELLSMDWIDINVITVYMCLLHAKYNLASEGVSQVGFVYPGLVCAHRNDKGKPATPVDIRARALCDRLQKGDKRQYLFMPYNPKNHWVLIVFNMKNNEVFYLDSLGNAPDADLERLLNIGMQMFTTTMGQRQKWAYTNMVKYVKTPLQPGGTECGYYVMRFMKELMLDLTLMTNNFCDKRMYSQKELDDVRVEWGLHFSKILAETGVDKADGQ